MLGRNREKAEREKVSRSLKSFLSKCKKKERGSKREPERDKKKKLNERERERKKRKQVNENCDEQDEKKTEDAIFFFYVSEKRVTLQIDPGYIFPVCEEKAKRMTIK